MAEIRVEEELAKVNITLLDYRDLAVSRGLESQFIVCYLIPLLECEEGIDVCYTIFGITLSNYRHNSCAIL